jgi:Lar family restriction alleviation protein
MSELKACPFCGCNDIDTDYDGDGNFWRVCKRCGAEGPILNKRSDVDALDWNTRTPELPNPCTIEQYEKITGEKFPENGAVWRQEILSDLKGEYVVYHLTTWKNYKPYASPEILEKWLKKNQPAIVQPGLEAPGPEWRPE